MKKNFILILGILLFAEMCFAKDYKVDFEYSMLVKSGKGSSGKNESIAKVLNQSESSFNLILPDFVFSEKMTIASFEIKDVEFKKDENGNVFFSKEKFSSNNGKYEISGNNLNGRILNNGEIEFSVSYKAGKMPFKLNVKYSGKEIL